MHRRSVERRNHPCTAGKSTFGQIPTPDSTMQLSCRTLRELAGQLRHGRLPAWALKYPSAHCTHCTMHKNTCENKDIAARSPGRCCSQRPASRRRSGPLGPTQRSHCAHSSQQHNRAKLVKHRGTGTKQQKHSRAGLAVRLSDKKVVLSSGARTASALRVVGRVGECGAGLAHAPRFCQKSEHVGATTVAKRSAKPYEWSRSRAVRTRQQCPERML